MSNRLKQISCDITSLFKGDERNERSSQAKISLDFDPEAPNVTPVRVTLPISAFPFDHYRNIQMQSLVVHSNMQNQDEGLSGQTLNPVQLDTIKEMIGAVSYFADNAPDGI